VVQSIKTYPVNLKLEGQKCLVVGGGRVALRKVQALKECGPVIILISPCVVPELSGLIRAGGIDYRKRDFTIDDLDSMRLVVAATNDRELNLTVARACHEQGIFVNVVDNPGESTYFVPASLYRGSMCVSVSTDGKSPLLARRVRDYLKGQIGPEFAEAVSLLGELREEIINKYPDQAERQKIWEELLPLGIVETIKTGQWKPVWEQVNRCI